MGPQSLLQFLDLGKLALGIFLRTKSGKEKLCAKLAPLGIRAAGASAEVHAGYGGDIQSGCQTYRSLVLDHHGQGPLSDNLPR